MTDRIVRAGILSSDAVCSLSWTGEVFYRRLMSVADDYGRYDGRLPILRANLYPLQLEKVSDSDVGKWRLETAKAGLVRVYAVEGKEYVEIVKFNQRIQGKPKWPAPTGEVRAGPAINSDSPNPTVDHGDSPLYTETDTETKRPRALALTVSDLAADGIPEDLALEFLSLRKQKRAALTPRAWKTIKTEGQKAGLSPTQAVDKVVARGWTGFEASWVADDKPAAPAAKTRSLEDVGL